MTDINETSINSLHKRYLQAKARIEKLEAVTTGLWDLLDEIDTISDLAKDNDELYRKLVERVQLRRFQFGKTNGYDVVFSAALAGEKKDD